MKSGSTRTKNIASAQPRLVKNLRALIASQPEAKPQIPNPVADGKAKKDRAALFDRKDSNHDNILTREEFLANQPDPSAAPKRFERFDANKDGVLSREEFIHMGVLPKP